MGVFELFGFKHDEGNYHSGNKEDYSLAIGLIVIFLLLGSLLFFGIKHSIEWNKKYVCVKSHMKYESGAKGTSDYVCHCDEWILRTAYNSDSTKYPIQTDCKKCK